MIDSVFWDKTRLSIISSPAFVLDEYGKLRYFNKSFGKLAKMFFRNDDTEFELHKYTDESVIEKYRVVSSDLDRDFYLFSINILTENVRVFISADIANRNFPKFTSDRLCFELRTFSEMFSVPFFGGKIIKSKLHFPGRRLSKKSAFLSEFNECAADLDVKYVNIKNIIEEVTDCFGKRIAANRYVIENEFTLGSDSICKLNIFDITMTIELILMVLLRRTKDRKVKIILESSNKSCAIIFKTSIPGKGRTVSIPARNYFESSDACGYVMESVDDLCTMYSWKLVFRTGRDGTYAILTLPSESCKKLVFANDDDLTLRDEIANTTDLINDCFSCFCDDFDIDEVK